MNHMRIATINRRLKQAGIPLELWRGDGYHHFTYDDGVRYEGVSVMVCYTNQLTLDQWLYEARIALDRIQRRIAA